jgi:PAS domain-containing protein
VFCKLGDAMKNAIKDIEEILNHNVSGFHQYVLTEPFHLSFVSQNFCDMLGFAESELLCDCEDKYAQLVYAADKKQYFDFLYKLSQKEQKLTLQYRIIKKDGTICYLSDTIVSKRLEDGTIIGHSVLTDISELKNENNNLQFLNETIPCGFLKYTCEKLPKITYINDQMVKMLRFPEVKDGELDYLEIYKDNIYLMIPMEERRRFSLYLNRVYKQATPIAGEVSVLRCDGTKGHFFGWVTKITNEQGIEEFQSVCMDITEKYHIKKENQTKKYIKALTDVYDKIFEFDLLNNTVKYLYGKNTDMYKLIENIPMQITDATEKWIINTVHEDDREKVRTFFSDFYKKRLFESDLRPPQIRYRALSSSGKMKSYTGIFLKVDSSVSLYCCRNMVEVDELASLRSEAVTLKNINENIQELVMHFTDGIAGFEINGEMVTPLYASDNVCDFFGFTKDEWLSLMKKSSPIKEFVSHSEASYEDIMNLLEKGEAEFIYYDLSRNIERRIKAICSQKSPDGSTPRYIMLYDIDDRSKNNAADAAGKNFVSIRTFGYFDVFVDGKPIAFRSQKSKELLALLIDRRGGYVSSDEAISFLWEDEPVNTVTLARYRKVALRLKNILEEHGISEVVESVDGKRRIATDKVQCDLYDYLSGKEEFSQLFKGSYLNNYSWGETTLGELTNNHLV